MLCRFSFPVNSWGANWGATCVDSNTSLHTCYPHWGWAASFSAAQPHWGWAALKEAWHKSQASCEKGEDEMQKKRVGRKNCWVCRSLVGDKTAPSHDLHGPSTVATWSTNIGMASWGYGNLSTSGSISPIFILAQDVPFIHVEVWRNTKKEEKRQNKREGETMITSSYNNLC